MSRIALSYQIPFVDSVTMPARWARWLASRGISPSEAIRDAPEESGTITWRHEEQGLLPWMQFFYDWRFADLTGDGRIDYLLTCCPLARGEGMACNPRSKGKGLVCFVQ